MINPTFRRWNLTFMEIQHYVLPIWWRKKTKK
jgi:hypothetical protein